MATPGAFEAFTVPPFSSSTQAIGEATLREPSAPEMSPQSLLERASALGPARLTWESMVLPDPILDEKQQPHVAERRERFRRLVTMGLGGCVGMCVLALLVTLITGNPSANASEPVVADGTVPAKVITPVETLGGARYAKVQPVATPASIARRAAKRR